MMLPHAVTTVFLCSFMSDRTKKLSDAESVSAEMS